MATTRTTSREKVTATKRRIVASPMYPKPDKRRRHFDMETDLAHRLKVFAAVHGLTMNEVVIRALETYMDQIGAPKKVPATARRPAKPSR